MCGIGVRLGGDKCSAWDRVKSCISKRGPDYSGHVNIVNPPLSFFSSVLHLRGTSSTQASSSSSLQPIQDSHGNLLLFNGELFYTPFPLTDSDNDASKLSLHLESLIHPYSQPNSSSLLSYPATQAEDPQMLIDRCLDCISLLRGPWALVFYIKHLNCLLFGRDMLGRRSLLWNLSTASSVFYLSSVGGESGNNNTNDTNCNEKCDNGHDIQWEEVPADGLYLLDLNKMTTTNMDIKQSLSLFPWMNPDGVALTPESPPCQVLPSRLMRPFGKLEDSIPLDIGTVESITTNTTVIDNFYDMLTEAVRIRICNIPTLFSTISPTSTMPRLGILFSGGLDCMVLAALAHAHVPLYEPIDLLTVAFENPRVIEARAAREAAASLSKSKKQERLHRSRKQLPYVTLLNQGDDARGNTTDIHSSKIVAAVPSSAHVLSNSSKTPYDDVPDRITARQGVSELRNRYPNRKWNLVEVDVSHAEMSKWKAHVIGLTKPSDSVMDLSISIAFWFAARGHGTCVDNQGTRIDGYSSPCKVLFSGLGADEQLGGYGRHRSGFEKKSWQGLIDELQLDLNRISTRNLGRDDRIVSDHGKEIRFPYLDESVITFLSRLPVHVKVDPRLPKGHGDKLVLRQLALDSRVGPLTKTAVEMKRAIQFGARTAKMLDKTERGQDKLLIC